MDGVKSRGIQGCEPPVAFPHQHPLGEHHGGWSWTRDTGGDGRDNIQPLGPYPATKGSQFPGKSSLQFDPSPSIVRHWVFSAHGSSLAMQELAAEDGDGMQDLGQSGNRSGCIQDVSTAWGHGWCECLLEAEVGLANCCCLPLYKAPWELDGNPSLGTSSSHRMCGFVLVAGRKHSLLRIISLDQQEKSRGLGQDCWDRGARVEAAWEEVAK